MDDSSHTDPTVRAMKHILNLDVNDFHKLLKFLTSDPLPKSGIQLEKQALKLIPDLEESQVEAIIGFSTAFAGALSQIIDKDDFIDSVVGRAKREFGTDDGNILDQRLRALFEAPAIAFIGGGGVAIRENMHFLMRSQINTDLRPIAMPQESPTMKHFAVVHRLRLHYAENLSSESERISELVLDYGDLKDLRDSINVALDTQKALQKSVAEMGGFTYAAQDDEEENDE